MTPAFPSTRLQTGTEIGRVNAVALRPADTLITGELETRPRRTPDLLAEAKAFHELSALMIDQPQLAVKRFLELAVALCDAGSAGLSLLETVPDGERQFRWSAVAGPLSPHIGYVTPFDFSPCGLCLAASRRVLLSRSFRAFGYLEATVQPLMEELVVPLFDTGGAALGTIWVVHHHEDKRFDAEDARVMEQLAVQLVLALKLRGERSKAVDTGREIEALKAANAELIDVGAFLRGVLASTADGIIVLDLAGGLLFMSEGARRQMEIDDFEPHRGQPSSALWDAETLVSLHEALATARAGGVGRFRGPGTAIEGAPKFWDVQITPIVDDNGVTQQLLAIARDVTQERKAEKHRALLTRELEHRIKNTLAMVSAIVNQTFRSAVSIEAAQETLVLRIAALGHAHDILTQSSWISAPIQAVVQGALGPHHSVEGRIRIAGPDLRLAARQSLALALAINELATNAAKYGSLSREAGRVDITWCADGAAKEAAFEFEWRELGGPPVTVPTRRGFGSRLIERSLASDFGGDVRIDYAPAGVICLLKTTLGHLQPETAG